MLQDSFSKEPIQARVFAPAAHNVVHNNNAASLERRLKDIERLLCDLVGVA